MGHVFNSVLHTSPATPAPAPVYADESLIKQLDAQHGTTKWSLNKLVQLIHELNSNFAAENLYACHVPPALNAKYFEQLASSPPSNWTKTDMGYLQKLKDFKPQDNDALHCQIRTSENLITMGYIPPQAWPEALLRLVIDALYGSPGVAGQLLLGLLASLPARAEVATARPQGRMRCIRAWLRTVTVSRRGRRPRGGGWSRR
ncbi:hypothetical protein AB0478_39480 [Streptomyces sp. NPDC051917]|uniref:hypothetical protein n=1 Tax=Streptomyces sp. NPDC051917 TaxID=3154754 RepID=UPI0034517C41